ncbi:MAG: FecR family protein [Treponema sp.]|nr:FecR family protein [Treponema sp.]
MGEKTNKKISGGFKPADIFVIILFLFTAALSVNMFRLDLMQTINLRNVEPIGTVIIRKNVVQRRLSDRVLWDRLASESPVYLGDLIRVADLSEATLYIDGSSIDLSENTLIRITRAADGEGLQIIMDEGNLSLAAAPDSGRISLEVKGQQVQAAAGSKAVISVKAASEGMILQVNEGSVQVKQSAQSNQSAQSAGSVQTLGVSAGNKITLDTRGAVREVKSASVTSPAPNARFINGSAEPLTVNFSWNRINLTDEELLRLDISADRNFRQISHVRENLERNTAINLESGLWYWRLSYQNTVYDQGRIAISNGAGIILQSPAVSSIFNYTNKPPVIRFKWDEISEASSYIIEVSGSPEFETTQIQRQSIVTIFSDQTLTEGTWYWRVKPVFPSVYIGNASFSHVSHFRIEKRNVVSESQTAAESTQAEESIATSAALTEIAAEEKISLSEWFAKEIPPELVRQAIAVSEPESEIITTQTAAADRTTTAVRAAPRVTEPSPLPAPQNLQPVRGRRITMSDLQTQRSINFTWNGVIGANSYVLTIFRQTGNRRQQIFQTQPLRITNYSFDNLSLLDRGTFVWQVEALNRRADGSINQRGPAAESNFIMDIVLPGSVRIDGSGVADD